MRVPRVAAASALAAVTVLMGASVATAATPATTSVGADEERQHDTNDRQTAFGDYELTSGHPDAGF